MVSAALELLQVRRIPSLEPVMQAAIDAIEALFSEAANAIEVLSPDADVDLVAPAEFRLTGAGYDFPTNWPAVVIGGSNLRRVDAPNSAPGGTWRAELQFHCWLQDDDPDRLFRALDRYAAVLWLILCSADAGKALARAELVPQTFAIAPYPDPGQSLAQQAIVLRVDVGLRA